MTERNPTQEISLNQHLVYICSRVLAYGLPLLFFLVTTTFYLKTYDSAQIKITFTQIGTAFLFIVWMAKVLIQGKLPFQKRDLVFVAPFIAFLASGFISFLHSPFKMWALEETLRRVFYMILALITIAEMNSEERMRRLWRWLMAAAWFSTGYGLIQYLDSRLFNGVAEGIDPFIWRQAFGTRVFSTFGNPNFYGNFLVIITPLILASVLRNKGSVWRPFVVLVVTMAVIAAVDKITLGRFGGYDPSFQVIYGAVIVLFLVALMVSCIWRVGSSLTLPSFLVLFSILSLNLVTTETKGAWLGFVAAVAVTIWLIFEFFLHTEDRSIEPKNYLIFIVALAALYTGMVSLLVVTFVIPVFTKPIDQVGFQILWIPSVFAGIAALATLLWISKKPWNLKKVIYGLLFLFVITMGTGVLQFAKERLISVSFRMFTWISTWEMIRTEPLLGSGVGTFKVIYPAFRRPQIIVLEGKSNTETDHAEDEYLEVWQDEGIIGFGIFLWLITTAIVCGLSQLRWYSNLRSPTLRKKKFLDLESDPRSYEVLGLLGAFIGALLHWCVDVSIRFVSSGVFSGLLPGALVAYSRNHENPIQNEVRLPYDRWIRAGIAGVWTGIFLWLGIELVPQSMIQGGDTGSGQILFFSLLAGAGLFLLMELLERGLGPSANVPFTDQYPEAGQIRSMFTPIYFPYRAALFIGLLGLGVFSVYEFGNHFRADVHHNLAIFFSKEAIWTKAPAHDARISNFPPDIRKKYQRWGGALEHYQEVISKNPAFPMAHYFTGNVYNDWGSQKHAESMQARARNDLVEATRLRQKALELWDKAEQAYTNTKKLAPNYVQTHHQVGLLYVKRAENANDWGEVEKAQAYYEKAIANFRLYRMLDPVFPPNYDRLAQLLLMKQQYKEVQELYKDAIYQNDVVARSIHKRPFADRVAALSISLAKVFYTEAVQLNPNPFNPPLPQILEAVHHFSEAIKMEPKNIEALKGYGFLLDKIGKKQEAQAVYQKAIQLAPNDPDLKASMSPK